MASRSSELERIIGDARYTPVAVRLIGPPPSSAPSPARSYSRYRAKFLTPELISAGSRFWAQHAEELARAEEEFGVPSHVIVGILGVETNFGRNTGSFRAIDALATIAFDGVRRQEYFREELKQLLLLARESRHRPLGHQGLVCRARWACRSSCLPAIGATPWTTTATAPSTC